MSAQEPGIGDSLDDFKSACSLCNDYQESDLKVRKEFLRSQKIFYYKLQAQACYNNEGKIRKRFRAREYLERGGTVFFFFLSLVLSNEEYS